MFIRYFLFADYKACLNTVYSAIEEADFLAIDGEFSGNVNRVRSFYFILFFYENGRLRKTCMYACKM